MPTYARVGPYRFFFYANDAAEPAHIHVERESGRAKFWLDPVRLESNRGFSRHEIGAVRRIVEERRAELLRCWNDFFYG
jgi:uncharacterized protein DUF4160